ncbi:MAG: hypothetical protein WBN83_16725 [Desulfoprunum sp.]|jgi:hypothetical protein
MLKLNLVIFQYDLLRPVNADRAPVSASVKIITDADLQSIDKRRQWPI